MITFIALAYWYFAVSNAPWRVVYDGHGTVSFGPSGEIEIAPQAAESGTESHAALVLSRETEEHPIRDFAVFLDFNVERQLRADEPKPWEAFWLFFNYRQKSGQKKETNYFLLKPNGMEIGRAFAETGQDFLYTGDTLKLDPLGEPIRLIVIKRGQQLDVLLQDPKGKWASFHFSGGDHPPGLYDVPGAIGLYSEDAVVRIRSARIELLD